MVFDMVKRVELLAPCGSYESFLAAVNAGADAVYMGGRQFGARAYAENFSEEELIGAIREAHLRGVKVYLTVNTLVKEREFSGLYDYMAPLYEAGLDGAIVQDMGVLSFFRRSFPGLKLHASTQMTITSAYGAAYLKELGCERIVPARELSLKEIREIKREVPVEIESFIHGAMCYCYSGQCLMSSMIGGRSGNRGRCAGPCRLPYRAVGKEGYYLSLKDMNLLEHIPELVEAGIDSFKIEGRMKKPEYVAGVVAVYRKYIDRYYSDKKETETGRFAASAQDLAHVLHIEEKDRKLLSDLYIRSETGTGYYQKRNGKDMLTLYKPGYNEADLALLAKLREKYVKELPGTEVRFFVRCRAGEPLYGEVHFSTGRAKGKSGAPDTGVEFCLSVAGDVVEKAHKRAVSAEEIKRQLIKTGGTPFVVKECIVEAAEDIFVPMSRINALRRALLQKIYACCGARDLAETGEGEESIRHRGVGDAVSTDPWEAREREDLWEVREKSDSENGKCTLCAVVQTKEQFETIFSTMDKEKECLIVDADLLLEDGKISEKLSGVRIRWGIKCPVILRKSDEKFLQRLGALIEEKKPDMIYCATIDMLAWLKSISYTRKIAGEASLYAWNAEAVSFWSRELNRISVPFELSSREVRELCRAVRGNDQVGQKGEEPGSAKTPHTVGKSEIEALVYGRAPFMVSANCIKLSTGNCDKNRTGYTELTDRMGNTFPVYTCCSHCYNIIYNHLPSSYEEDLWMLLEDGIKAFRVEFTTENGSEAAQVMQTFRRLLASDLKSEDMGKAFRQEKAVKQKRGKSAGAETTKGRFRLGVE